MADQTSVSNGDPSLILELTSRIDEYVFSYCDILSAVSVKRRKKAKSIIFRFFDQAKKSFLISSGVRYEQLIWVVIRRASSLNLVMYLCTSEPACTYCLLFICSKKVCNSMLMFLLISYVPLNGGRFI